MKNYFIKTCAFLACAFLIVSCQKNHEDDYGEIPPPPSTTFGEDDANETSPENFMEDDNVDIEPEKSMKNDAENFTQPGTGRVYLLEVEDGQTNSED